MVALGEEPPPIMKELVHYADEMRMTTQPAYSTGDGQEAAGIGGREPVGYRHYRACAASSGGVEALEECAAERVLGLG